MNLMNLDSKVMILVIFQKKQIFSPNKIFVLTQAGGGDGGPGLRRPWKTAEPIGQR